MSHRIIRFAFTAAAFVSLLAVPGTARADETIGSPLINRAFDGDNGSGVEVISLQGFTQPGVLTSWSFFSNNPNLTLPITPFVALRTAPNTYSVTGIGATRTNAGMGVQSFAFDLSSGSAAVGVDYFFGFHSGTTTTGTVGVVEVDTQNGGAEQYALIIGSNSLTVGTTRNYTPFGDTRIYSVQATAIPAVVVPEAGTFALALPALGMIAAVVIKRRKK